MNSISSVYYQADQEQNIQNSELEVHGGLNRPPEFSAFTHQ